MRLGRVLQLLLVLSGLVGILLGLVAGLDATAPLRLSQPRFGAGTVEFDVFVWPSYARDSLRVQLDGLPLYAHEVEIIASADALRLRLLVDRGRHLATLSVSFELLGRRWERRISHLFTVPEGAPELIAAAPLPSEEAVPTGQWLRLEFAAAVDPSVQSSFELACEGREIDLGVHPLAPGALVLNPAGQLPTDSDCTLAWRGTDRREQFDFATAQKVEPAVIVYDRTVPGFAAPFPDDYWTTPDAASPTGVRLAIPAARSTPGSRVTAPVFEALLSPVNGLDGFSPIAPLVLEFSAALDPTSIPRTPGESLGEMSTIALVVLDPRGAQRGERVPFRIELRSDASAAGRSSHVALIFPSIPLTPSGRYGLIVTRRVRAANGGGVVPSAATAASLAAAGPEEPPAIARVRRLVEPVLVVAEQILSPPIPRDDIALALVFTVRTLDTLPDDLLAARDQIFASPPPEYEITQVSVPDRPDSPVALVVRGLWRAPDWRTRFNWARDEDGRPQQTGSNTIPFTLTIPQTAAHTPAPVVMYQHGNPGRAEDEVASPARDYLARAGFAVVGFTDVLNREVSAGIDDPALAISTQAIFVLGATLSNRRLPELWLQTNAEQIAFLRLIRELGELDLLPRDAPDGVPDLDAAAPLAYLGISQGANHAPAFLPYAPEISAAVLVAGGARLAEVLIHQRSNAFLEGMTRVLPALEPVEVWMAVALFQAAFDQQDAHNHGRFLYREAFEVAGQAAKSSVLLIAGIGDSLIPNHASDSLAWQLRATPLAATRSRESGGMPRIAFLEDPLPEVQANVDSSTSSAYSRFAPFGLLNVAPSPGCLPPVMPLKSAIEGHYCAQIAAESRRQQANFLLSALRGGAPKIMQAVPGTPPEKAKSP